MRPEKRQQMQRQQQQHSLSLLPHAASLVSPGKEKVDAKSLLAKFATK